MAKRCAFIVVGNGIPQSFDILRCNCTEDNWPMSLNSEWNSNVKRYVTLNTICIGSSRFPSGGRGRMVEYKIHNTISFMVSIPREPFVLKMHNSRALFFRIHSRTEDGDLLFTRTPTSNAANRDVTDKHFYGGSLPLSSLPPVFLCRSRRITVSARCNYLFTHLI